MSMKRKMYVKSMKLTRIVLFTNVELSACYSFSFSLPYSNTGGTLKDVNTIL